MQCGYGNTCSKSVFDVLLDDRTKDSRYVLKIYVVVGGMWRVAQPRYQASIPFIFCELLCELLQRSCYCCSFNNSNVCVFHSDLDPFEVELGHTWSCVCSQAARRASFEGWIYV